MKRLIAAALGVGLALGVGVGLAATTPSGPVPATLNKAGAPSVVQRTVIPMRQRRRWLLDLARPELERARAAKVAKLEQFLELNEKLQSLLAIERERDYRACDMAPFTRPSTASERLACSRRYETP